jgi:hypothetical protein
VTENELRQATIRRRAIEAVIWGIPAVNYALMFQAAIRELRCGRNQIVYWSGLLDWHNQTLTPNPDAVYLMPFLDTRDGPVVLEIPPADGSGAIIGSVMDGWQVPLEDVGQAGADQGAGGKYLIVPPNYQGDLPDGFITLPSQTYGGYGLLRSSTASGADSDVTAAVEYGKRVKLYPPAQATDPPPTTFLDAAGAEFDSTIKYDLSFFETLDAFVQTEPWLPRDKVMIDVLKSLGIKQGARFAPDDTVKKALVDAADEAHVWLDWQYEQFFTEPFFVDTNWALPASAEVVRAASLGFDEPDSYPVDSRGCAYYWAFSGIKHMGAASST